MQGKSEEEVLAIGKAAAAEAAATVEKSVEDKDDMDDDAQARYYRCAGRPGATKQGIAVSVSYKAFTGRCGPCCSVIALRRDVGVVQLTGLCMHKLMTCCVLLTHSPSLVIRCGKDPFGPRCRPGGTKRDLRVQAGTLDGMLLVIADLQWFHAVPLAQRGAQRGGGYPGPAAAAGAARRRAAAGVPDGRPPVDGVPVQQPPQRHPRRRDGVRRRPNPDPDPNLISTLSLTLTVASPDDGLLHGSASAVGATTRGLQSHTLCLCANCSPGHS